MGGVLAPHPLRLGDPGYFTQLWRHCAPEKEEEEVDDDERMQARDVDCASVELTSTTINDVNDDLRSVVQLCLEKDHADCHNRFLMPSSDRWCYHPDLIPFQDCNCLCPLTTSNAAEDIQSSSQKLLSSQQPTTASERRTGYCCDFDGCSKTFSRKEEVSRHRKTHSGERNYECQICRRKFGRKDHLKKHVVTHGDVSKRRRYVCPVSSCGKKYTRSDALSRHRNSAHSFSLSSIIGR